MRRLTIIEHISLDGVVQAPGGRDEDPGYPNGGWAQPLHDPAVGAAIDAAQGTGFDLLLGRRTYDIFAGYWSRFSGDPMADSLNAATKFVATHRPDDLSWGPAEAIGPDLAEGVRRLKATEGPNLVLWGSSTVTPVVIGEGLADTIVLLTFPVLLGFGKRIFSEIAEPRELALVGSTSTASGVLINTYRPAGPLRTGTFDDPTA
ncbi:dihydrofolate reductase family protein [Brevundimonas sp.]|uniref:dihydrofolate reductase family protein n=1 Tax=Brevundimonas sp. TaxID=1871086 RepID=UPI0035B2D61D